MPEREKKESFKEWLAILGPIIVGVMTGMAFVISAFITKEPTVIYEVQQIPYYEKNDTTEIFPLKTGNIWHYKGRVTIPDIEHDGRTFKKEAELTVQVAEEISNNEFSLFIMNGHWRDLYDYWPRIKIDDKEPVIIPTQEYGYLIISNKIYYVPHERLDEAVEFMRNNDYCLAPIEPSGLEYEFPLFKGQRYGQIPDISRKDFNFCWYVNDETYNHVPDNGKVLTMPRYSMVYSMIYEYISLSFESYLGVTAYDYNHQGSMANFQLSLDSYDLK